MILIKEIQFINKSDDEIIIVNLITGAADIINSEIYNKLVSSNFDLPEDILSALLERRYVFNSENEYNAFLSAMNQHIDALEMSSEPNFVLIPSYACNLCCTYCYEQTYEINNNRVKDSFDIIDRQFHFIDETVTNFENNKNIRITIMGGEPLLLAQYDSIKYLIECAEKREYSIDVVTNGVDLDYFIPLLSRHIVDHIQVTVDGIKEIHDKRRVFHNGCGSFSKIISNVQKALNSHIKVYLRVNLDAENFSTLHLLAELLFSLENQDYLFPYIYLLQDGGCSGDSNVIKELTGISQIYALEKEHSEVSIFSKRYHPIHFIDSIFNNQRFQPCLRHCGASRNQYILDSKGLIYKCWHGIGNEAYACGKYIPEVSWNELNLQWKKRSVMHIEKCIECKYRYICGTGCPAATHNDVGCFDINKESCVDYKSLIETLVKIHLEQ